MVPCSRLCTVGEAKRRPKKSQKNKNGKPSRDISRDRLRFSEGSRCEPVYASVIFWYKEIMSPASVGLFARRCDRASALKMFFLFYFSVSEIIIRWFALFCRMFIFQHFSIGELAAVAFFRCIFPPFLFRRKYSCFLFVDGKICRMSYPRQGVSP